MDANSKGDVIQALLVAAAIVGLLRGLYVGSITTLRSWRRESMKLRKFCNAKNIPDER